LVQGRTPVKPEDYRDYARYFDFFSNPYVLPDAFKLVDVLTKHLPKKATVVDVGGGTGLVAEELLDQRPDLHLTLIEPSAEMISQARARVGEPHVLMNATLKDALPELEPSTAFVFNRSLYGFFGEREPYVAFFEQLKEKIEPGGYVGIFDLHEKYDIAALKAFFDDISPEVPGWDVKTYEAGWPTMLKALEGFNEGVDSGRFMLFDEEQLNDLLGEAGLAKEYTEANIFLYRLPGAKKRRWFGR
jgi:hypothetical protein